MGRDLEIQRPKEPDQVKKPKKGGKQKGREKEPEGQGRQAGRQVDSELHSPPLSERSATLPERGSKSSGDVDL